MGRVLARTARGPAVTGEPPIEPHIMGAIARVTVHRYIRNLRHDQDALLDIIQQRRPAWSVEECADAVEDLKHALIALTVYHEHDGWYEV